MSARTCVTKVVTSGTFSLDGGTWEVDSNVWVVGDESECVMVDAAHDAQPIVDAVGDRKVLAILLTHAHDGHISGVSDLAAAVAAPSYLHPADRVLWDKAHSGEPDRELADGDIVTVGGIDLRVLHTPGHTYGACCLHAPELGAVFTGDTLFNGGPGAAGRSFSDFPMIIDSIANKILTLPAETTVHPGHGPDTVVGAEAADLDAWIARGH